MLTAKQRHFVAEYLGNGRNGAAAYRAVYGGNPSNRRAAEEACRLLAHPNIAPMVAETNEREKAAVVRVMDRLALDKERVAELLARQALANITDILSWDERDVTVKPSAMLDPDVLPAITEISIKDGKVRVKLADKRAALMDLAKLRGWLVEKRETRKVLCWADLTDEELAALTYERSAER
jgi:phage terminase small subunit